MAGGPQILKRLRDYWPENLFMGDIGQSVAFKEQIKNLPSTTYTKVQSSTNPPLKACVLGIIDIDHFSKRSILIRTVA